MTSFADLGLPAHLDQVLAAAGIHTPTPIQAATLPDALAGRDVLGRGRTGSGKTYAFGLPLIARTTRADRGAPQALVLAPTRELAVQIERALEPLARAQGLTTLAVFGGVPIERQRNALRRGVDVLVACPGRLEDLVARRWCDLSSIAVTVIDEADHMADLGFLPAVRRLLTLTPRGGQRLLFSATLDQAVDVLARQFLREPVQHEVEPEPEPTEAEMTHHVLHIDREHRLAILADLISSSQRTVVFTRTKYGAKGLARQLDRRGIKAVELHGNLAQNARTRNLDAFHAGQASTLVATDIAARGIHVDDVELVIHADPPAEHKAYVHRSGRTARAGRGGAVITLATDEQLGSVRDLTRAAGLRPGLVRVNGSEGLDWDTVLGEAPGDAADWAAVTGPAGASAGESSRASRAPGSGGGRGRRGGNGGNGNGGNGNGGSGNGGSRGGARNASGRSGAGRGGNGPAAGRGEARAEGRGGRSEDRSGGAGRSGGRGRRGGGRGAGAGSASSSGGHSAASFSSSRSSRHR